MFDVTGFEALLRTFSSTELERSGELDYPFELQLRQQRRAKVIRKFFLVPKLGAKGIGWVGHIALPRHSSVPIFLKAILPSEWRVTVISNDTTMVGLLRVFLFCCRWRGINFWPAYRMDKMRGACPIVDKFCYTRKDIESLSIHSSSLACRWNPCMCLSNLQLPWGVSVPIGNVYTANLIGTTP